MASTAAYNADNIFAKIIDGKIPSHKLFETEHALAILDAFPMARGHALLLPKASGYAELYDMPPDVAASVLRELPRLCKAVREATGCDGVNVVVRCSASAGTATVYCLTPVCRVSYRAYSKTTAARRGRWSSMARPRLQRQTKSSH